MSDIIGITLPAQRPRLVRNEDGGLDEKTAAFFVDKVIRAVAEDVGNDHGVAALVNGPPPSLGNVKGQERFLRRMEKQGNAGRATLWVAGATEKKRFSFIWDRLCVASGRLEVARTSGHFRRNHEPSIITMRALVISRHALIRSVQHVQIKSVDDVFKFLFTIWRGLWLLMLVVMGAKITTTGDKRWLVPVPFGKHRLWLLIARPTTKAPPALVTVYPERWVPDTVLAVAEEFRHFLDLADDMALAERDAGTAALLSKLLV